MPFINNGGTGGGGGSFVEKDRVLVIPDENGENAGSIESHIVHEPGVFVQSLAVNDPSGQVSAAFGNTPGTAFSAGGITIPATDGEPEKQGSHDRTAVWQPNYGYVTDGVSTGDGSVRVSMHTFGGFGDEPGESEFMLMLCDNPSGTYHYFTLRQHGEEFTAELDGAALLTDAPNDGKSYVRCNEKWVEA